MMKTSKQSKPAAPVASPQQQWADDLARQNIVDETKVVSIDRKTEDTARQKKR